jgi:hypothetical protein
MAALGSRTVGCAGRHTVDKIAAMRLCGPGSPHASWRRPVCINGLSVAATESLPAHEAEPARHDPSTRPDPPELAAGFWRRVEELVREFTQLPRSGDTVFGLVAGLHPTDHPTLPEANHESAEV